MRKLKLTYMHLGENDMKKHIRPLLSIIIIAIAAVFAVAVYSSCEKIKYNNDKTIDILVTETYSASKIQKMKSSIENNKLTYSQLRSDYNIQCLRKTYQGYYAVFLQDDGSRVFVFINENKEPYKILVIDEIKNKSQYDFIEVGKTTKNEILNYDENTLFMPVSSVITTAYITKEGVLLVTYDNFDEVSGMILDDAVVKSITFYNNSDFPLKNSLIDSNIPYILEVDKK